MTPRRIVFFVVMVLLAFVVGFASYAVPRWRGGPSTHAVAAARPTPPPQPGRKIKARLFYVSDDGTRLTSLEREVPYAEAAVDQAREIVAAQIGPVAEPLVSAIPPGTTLRALFLTERGDAFVDLSKDVVDAHPGGSINELLTIYTIVNALTANMPAIHSVQVLVNGKEVDTIAGHVDVRRPLAKNLSWVQ
jgi:spore germination protein GerM